MMKIIQIYVLNIYYDILIIIENLLLLFKLFFLTNIIKLHFYIFKKIRFVFLLKYNLYIIFFHFFIILK